jgi:hypothetical protein
MAFTNGHLCAAEGIEIHHARVATPENVDVWTKTGVMMRNTLAANSAHAAMFVTPGKGLAFQRRRSAGDSSTHTSGGLVRTGSQVSAYMSEDGDSWSLVGSDIITWGSTIYVGLPVTSHRGGRLATTTIDNVSVSDGG